MPGRRCAIFGCNNSRVVTKTKNSSIIYHTFPKDTDSVSSTILKKWITCCKRAEVFNPRTSVICSTHFTANDYERDLQNELLGLPLKKILKKTAVPTFNIPGKIENVATTSIIDEPCEKKKQKNLVKSLLNASSRDDGIFNAGSQDKHIETCSPSETVFMQPSFAKNEPQHSTQASPDVEKQTSLTSTLIQSLETVEKKYSDLLQAHSKLKTEFSLSKKKNQHKIKSLNAQVKYYKFKYSPNTCFPKQKEKTAENLLGMFLTKNQIDLLLKKKKVVRWTPEEIAIALTILYYSKTCYLYIKNKLHYPLPSLSSLRRCM